MKQRVYIRRTRTPNNPPNGLAPGELFVEMADPVRLWTGVPASIDPTQRKLLIDVSAPTSGGGGGAQVFIADVPPPSPNAGDLWWESDTGALFVYYSDANSPQWIGVAVQGPIGPPGPTGISAVTIGATPPTSPHPGDLWWESDTGELFIY